MKKIIHFGMGAIAFALMLGVTSCGNKKAETDSKEAAEEQNEAKIDLQKDLKDDYDFAVDAADGGMLEVQLGTLALNNGATDRVREFGQMMVTEHTKANAELIALAAKKNITLPTALSEKCQKKYNDLAGKKGLDFDKAYTALMVDGHKDNIDAFKKEGENGKDAELKAWAYEKVPTLEKHLEISKANKEAVRK